MFKLSSCKFCRYADKINLLKNLKNMVFWPIFDPKISFLRFYPGKLRDIASKPLLIDSMVKNTSRKVYLESLTYRAENARKSFYYNGQPIMLMKIITWSPQMIKECDQPFHSTKFLAYLFGIIKEFCFIFDDQ